MCIFLPLLVAPTVLVVCSLDVVDVYCRVLVTTDSVIVIVMVVKVTLPMATNGDTSSAVLVVELSLLAVVERVVQALPARALVAALLTDFTTAVETDSTLCMW